MSAPAISAVDPAWLKNARDLVGLKEIVGSRHELKVLQFFAEAGHPEIHNDETAWCAAFANAMLRRAGCAGTGSLAARSFLAWGEKLPAPKLGCIVVFKRGNSAWQGHVAFFLRDLSSHVEVLGGNQGNAVSVARYSKADVLGYRWPAVKAAAPAPAKVAKKDAAKVVAGGAVVAGVGKAVEKGANEGWGVTGWGLLILAIVGCAAAAWFGWRWWQRHQIEAQPEAPVQQLVAAAKERPAAPRRLKRRVAKPAGKRRAAAKKAA